MMILPLIKGLFPRGGVPVELNDRQTFGLFLKYNNISAA